MATVSTKKTTKKKSLLSKINLEDYQIDPILLLERMVRVEEGTKNIQKEMVFLREGMDRKFEEADKKFDLLREDMDKRFILLREEMDKRFESVDKRFEAVDKRFDKMDTRIDSLSSTIKWLAGIGFAYISILMTVLKIFG